MTRLAALPVLLLLSALRTTLAASQCYFPNGFDADGNFPCDPDAEHSVCCGGGLGSVCLSNKLCGSSNGNVIRGACTDDNWKASECPMFCLGAATGGTDLISCSNVTSTDTSFCCDHTVDCCDSGVGRFNVLPSEAGIWATFDVKASQYVVVGTVIGGKTTSTSKPPTTTSTTSSTKSKTTSTSEPVSTTISENSSTGPTTSTTSSAQSQETGEQLQDLDSSKAKGGLSTGAMAGIGVGVGLLVLAIIAAIIFFFCRRRKAKSEPVMQTSELPGHMQGAGVGYAGYGYQQKPPQEMVGSEGAGNGYHGFYKPQGSGAHELDGGQTPGYDMRAELPSER